MKTIILFLFLLISYSIFSSCNNILQKKFEFFYYPSKNVYYDVANKLYIYSLDGGNTWDSSYATTDKEPATLGNKQIIYSPTPNVWVNNNEHLQQYNGRLISIENSDSSNTQEDMVADRKIKKAKPVVTTTAKEPEKKPGFFKRLFGKKNK
jgi:hypothetical protein